MKIKKIIILLTTFIILLLGSAFIPKMIIGIKTSWKRQVIIPINKEMSLSNEEQIALRGNNYDPAKEYFFKIKVVNYYTSTGLSYKLSKSDTLEKILFERNKENN